MWSDVVMAGDSMLAVSLLVLIDLVGAALLLRRAKRRSRRDAQHAWTEPLDLETLRRRMRIVEAEPAPQLPHTRELLDELHRGKQRTGPGTSGVAGGSRRR